MKFILLLGFLLNSTAFAKDVTYQYEDQTYEGFLLSNGKKAPTIFLVHDWDGLTDYEIKRAKMLASNGYSVFAIDLFGKGVRPTEVKDKRQHTGALYEDRKKMRGLLQAALNTAAAKGLNTKRAVAVGYCFGGAAVLEWARSGENFKGFATFHGGLATPEGQDYKKAKGTVLVFHGTADKAITMGDFAKLADTLEETNIAHRMTTYGGADHAFTVFDSDRYHKEADRHSWARLMEFLKTI